jgi:glutamate:GABA antiporter
VFAVVAPVVVYNFLGFELPSAAGEELRDPARDVPASIDRGTASPDAHLPDGFAGQRLAFTVAELVPLGLVLLAAFLLARTRRSPAR